MPEPTLETLDARLRAVSDIVHRNSTAIDKNREAIDKNRGAIDKNREAIDKNREAILDNGRGISHAIVLIEALRSDLQTVAEGVSGIAETLTAYKGEVDPKLNDLDRRVTLLEAREAARG